MRFCLRVTVAALAALALVQTFCFPLHGLWTVPTAIVVTQVSIGGSLRATVEYISAHSAARSTPRRSACSFPHHRGLAGSRSRACDRSAGARGGDQSELRVAPFSAVIVLLIGEISAQARSGRRSRACRRSPSAAWSRSPSRCLWSQNDHRLSLEVAAESEQMADVLPQFLSGFTRNLDAAEIRRLQDDLGRLVTGFQEITAEARRERVIPFTRAPYPAPLSRSSLRLRHDLVILGVRRPRRCRAPLLSVWRRCSRMWAKAQARFCSRARSLTQDRPPALEPVEAPLDAFDSEVAALRSEGLTRTLSTAEVERLFALCFGLDQLRHNFSDLARCVREFAPGAGGRENS